MNRNKSNKNNNSCDPINKVLCNTGINIGVSSRLDYDKCYINDNIRESTDPLLYQLSTDRIYNCNNCNPRFGYRPSSGTNAASVATLTGPTVAISQELVNLESILSNRNVKQSKCKDGKVNPIDVLGLPVVNPVICDSFLDPISTHLTNPAQNYRGIAINRFYDLRKDPQANIYYDWGVNSRLEAKDNHVERIPRIMPDLVQPIERRGPIQSCKFICK